MAVNVTVCPGVSESGPQKVPLLQSMPAGLVVTWPEPDPSTATKTGILKFAVTVTSVVPNVITQSSPVPHPDTPLQARKPFARSVYPPKSLVNSRTVPPGPHQ